MSPSLTIEDYATCYLAGVAIPGFVGDHSVAELRELLAAKDYEQDQIEIAVQKLGDALHQDPTWQAEWSALQKSYQAARKVAAARIAATSIVPANYDPAETEFQGILRSLTLNPGHYTRGDIEDLYIRLRAIGGTVDESHVPQPSASADSEMVAFKKLDAAAKAIEDAARKAKEAATPELSTTLTIALVALGVGALVYAIKK